MLPRRIPNFPGRFLGLYVTVSVLFFVAMLSAVLIFGKEKSEAARRGAHDDDRGADDARGASTPSAKGDPTAGKPSSRAPAARPATR